MNRHTLTRQRRQTGFTLIELMVGVLLGMLTILVIAQVMVISESRKRTATSGSDAQLSGALATYAVQREVQMAGYGVSNNPAALGCTVQFKTTSAPAGTFTLAPVVITAGTNGSSVLTTLRSQKTSFALSLVLTSPHALGDDHFTVQSTLGVDPGDLLIAIPLTPSSTSPCKVIQASSDATTSSIPQAVVASAPWNQATAATIPPTVDFPSKSYVINVGSLVLRQYSMDAATHTLQLSDLSGVDGTWSAAQSVQSEVVMFKALYGKDTDANGQVDQFDSVSPTDSAGWQQVISVRIMVVTRSTQYEKEAVGSGDPLLWDLGTSDITVIDSNAQTCKTSHRCISVALSYLGDDWSHYRYKVFETQIPLRNVLWNSTD